MIYPPITNLIEKTNSRYSLVIATAKRAREISQGEGKEVSKPVIEAINQIDKGIVSIDTNPDTKKDDCEEDCDKE